MMIEQPAVTGRLPDLREEPRAWRDSAAAGAVWSGIMIDLVGQRFGRVTVTSELEKAPPRRRMFSFVCDCGGIGRAAFGDLRSGHTASCGCLQRERTGAANRSHGYSQAVGTIGRMYWIWQTMNQRCSNPRSHDWKNYGGRGISVCERWRRSFEHFLLDVGSRPSPDLSIDRINNDGNYEPGNVRWTTRSIQNRNKRSTHPQHGERR